MGVFDLCTDCGWSIADAFIRRRCGVCQVPLCDGCFDNQDGMCEQCEADEQ